MAMSCRFFVKHNKTTEEVGCTTVKVQTTGRLKQVTQECFRIEPKCQHLLCQGKIVGTHPNKALSNRWMEVEWSEGAERSVFVLDKCTEAEPGSEPNVHIRWVWKEHKRLAAQTPLQTVKQSNKSNRRILKFGRVVNSWLQ